MSDDIIDRLRAAVPSPGGISPLSAPALGELCLEAADEMEQLHRRIIGLETELGAAYGAIARSDRESAGFSIRYEHGGAAANDTEPPPTVA